MSLKRLPKDQRREQLLDIAQKIVREEGSDMLTLGYLAEKAGVSKPIAYNHFKTRSGLLIALFQRMDEQHVDTLLQALQRAPRRLEDIAQVASDSYMHCSASVGPEWDTISAALKGDEEMEIFKQELLDGYVDIYCKAFAPYSSLKKNDLRLLCIAIIGAAEAIAREMLMGRTDEKKAAAALCRLMIKSLS